MITTLPSKATPNYTFLLVEERVQGASFFFHGTKNTFQLDAEKWQKLLREVQQQSGKIMAPGRAHDYLFFFETGRFRMDSSTPSTPVERETGGKKLNSSKPKQDIILSPPKMRLLQHAEQES